MIHKIKKVSIFLLSFLLPIYTFSQVSVPKVVSSTDNLLATVMIIIAAVLAFVIWGMGQVLIALANQLMEKNKKSVKTISLLVFAGLLLSSQTSNAQDKILNSVSIQQSLNYGGMGYTGFWTMATIIILEITAILFVMFFIKRIQQELIPESVKKSFSIINWWHSLDKKVFTKAIAVEKESDILLDHDYDGIKELDNSLPPWWKYGFYITITIGIIYLLNFHVFGYGKNPTQEYLEEIEQSKIDAIAYASKNADNVDESNIQMPLKSGLDEGKEIFTTICWTCHGKLGEGATGPNLTDAYWIHKGSLNDIYASIKHGYPEKGMQSWEKNYSPKQINNLAGYIITLNGTKPPNPKDPQGDLFIVDNSKENSVSNVSLKKSKK